MIIYAVNDYVWELLQQRHGWKEIKGNRPLLPAQQQPEFMNTSDPFLLYASSAEYNNGAVESMDSDIISYAIFDDSVDDANLAAETIKNAFLDFNSAHNITKWVKQSSGVVNDDRHIITYTEVMDRETSGIIASEGGKAMSTVTVRVGYKTVPADYDLT